MDKTKRGIALFITLLIIASILSIVAVSFSYLEKVQKDANKVSALIQGNILYQNTTEVLKRFFPKGKPNSKKIELLYTLPLMLNEPKSGFNINLTCNPLLVAVPIKWLDKDFTKKTPEKLELARKVLTYIIENYDIAEPNRLEEIIISKVTNKDTQDIEHDEPRLKQKKGIISKKQFYKILLDYRLRYDDDKIFKIPWDKYFVFIDVTNIANIDGNYATAEVISVAFDIPLESVKDSWQERSLDIEEDKMSLKKFLIESGYEESINEKLFSQNPLNAMHCEESYSYRDRYYNFAFDYSDERSVNFEFNGEI
jgi:hypothetical protein